MPKVFIGMSGGVDSSYSAYLLKSQGYDVTGVTFSVFDAESIYQPQSHAMSKDAMISAEKVCRYLGIPHRIVDLKKEFTERIVHYLIDSYRAGLTPNPCMKCNRMIKFGLFMDYALSHGADYFSTGHYIRITEREGEPFITRGADPSKDQSYFLALIESSKLPQILFPLGDYVKSDVKRLADEAGLPIDKNRSESQDVCFIDKDYRDFLRRMGVTSEPGEMVYQDKTVGRHHGIPFYSLGQRRGLGVAVGKRLFIREIDVANNRIILGDKPVSTRFTVRDLNVFTERFSDGVYETQVRYQSKPVAASVSIEDDRAEVELSEPHEIVAPGQFAVFYRDGLVYAGGEIGRVDLIEEIERKEK